MGEAKTGLFFALVGPGGAGKTTLLKAALGQIDNLRQLATATTRAPRAGEAHGRERYFLNEAEFVAQIRANAFYEYEEVHPGTFYGTPRADIDAALCAGRDLIADIDAKGACFLRVALPSNLCLVFVAPPDISTLRARLEGRGDAAVATQARIDRFTWEMAFADVCDEMIVNETLASAVAALSAIVETARASWRARGTLPFYARVLPIRRDCLNLRADERALPQTQLREHELPHEAAWRAIEENLHLPPRRENMSPGQIAARDFMPILHVTPSPDAVVFEYIYSLAMDERLPAGWCACPLEQAPLSSDVRAAIQARFQRQPTGV